MDSVSTILDRKFRYTRICKQETNVSYTAIFSCKELTHWKTLMLGGIGGRRRMGTTEDEMAGWHHRLNGREYE